MCLVPKTFVPHDNQREALAFMHSMRRVGLWMPMGGGKTVTTLTHLTEADILEPVFPALVLGPKWVIQSTWPDEVAKWAHTQHLRVSVVTGDRRQREAALRVPADLYCMAYDNLDWLATHCGDKWPFITVVADELTRLKGFRLRQGGKRAGALGKVAHKHVKRFIGLTGTPAPNGIKDLWGQTYFIDQGERLGRTFSSFEARWFYKGHDGYSLQPREHAHTEVMERVSDIYLTVKSLQVDEPIVVPIHVDLPPAVRKAYDQVEKDLFAEIEVKGFGALEIEASNAAVRLGKCLQIASGAVFDENGVWTTLHDAKLDALESIIEEANGMPVLVSYAYTHEAARILKRFKQARLLDDNPQTIKDWNAGKIPVLLAHPQSAGHGLNLQDGGNILVFFGLTFNLEHYMQIIERIGPLRQKQSGYDRPVYLYHILARDTFDEVAMDRLSGKRSVQDAVLAYMERSE
jgi:SNF2 family DNA or RNA helicase